MDKPTFVTRSSMPPFEEYMEEIRPIWESHWLTNMGEKHIELQKQLCDFMHVDHVELFTNGHMALELALQAFEMDGEVITTPFTFSSTTHAIVRNNLTPVFCDIEPEHYTMDVSKIESLITDKTRAIVPVHVYGNVCDVEEIDRIAKKHGLKVIYDAAHTFGEIYKGKSVAAYGDASMLSCHATKVFNTIEGGAIVCDDENIGKRMYNLKNFGIREDEQLAEVGANAKMSEFQAAMGICNLRHLDEEIAKRKKIYELYMSELQDVKGIKLCNPQEGLEKNYAYFPVYVDPAEYGADRDELFNRLAAEKIYPRKYFYPLITDYECYRGKYDDSGLENAKRIAAGILTIPMYADLEEEVVRKICGIIKRG